MRARDVWPWLLVLVLVLIALVLTPSWGLSPWGYGPPILVMLLAWILVAYLGLTWVSGP